MDVADNPPKTRGEAIDRGEKLFLSGRVCPRGHIPWRYTGSGDCVACAKERAARWKLQNKEIVKSRSRDSYAASGDDGRAKAAKRSRAYYHRNTGRLLEKQKRKYQDDPEKYRAFARDWREKNIEYARENSREWARCNRERMRQSAKDWRARNAEHVREKARESYARNKDAFKAHARNRKARKKNAEGRHTSSDIKRICLSQGNKCAVCQEKLIKSRTHVDHIIPLSKGGTNWPRNLQLLCQTCNLQKWTCDPIDFMQEKGFLL